jgi:bifunctional UDP-N-acetylglucosamine pyrophosphorylase/glucosamine-1-phosphate N-acetyltransferase
MSEGFGAEGELAVVVLAAGQGTRMKSERAKVLHEICGVPMHGHIQKVAEAVGADRLVVVIGRDSEGVRAIYGESAEFVVQAEQKGTGHAVTMAEPLLRDFGGHVLILYGDTPLLRASSLERMRATMRETGADLVMLTASGDIPGRVLRDAEGRVARIIEAQDASPEELAIEERNTGVYLISSDLLWAGLDGIDMHNAQGELYITDVVDYAVQKGYRVEALWLEDSDECLGINDRIELARATKLMQRRINEQLMVQGVTLLDPDTIWIDATVEIGQDSLIEPGVRITGQSVLGCGVHVKSGSYIEDSRLDAGVVFGPSSHLRPNCHLMAGVKIGNYVEIKNSTLGPGSKSAHLTYIGDADVGAAVNFGCGSVVVNYDGYEKHRTQVGDAAFVGCNANLIAPLFVAPHSFVAAGSTISLDVPQDALAVARARQRNVEGWVARKEGRAAPRVSGATPRVAAAPVQTPATKRKPAGKKKAAAKKKTARKKAVGSKKAVRRKSASKSARKKATKRKAARKRR